MTQGPGVETVSGRGERMFRRRVPSAGAAASRGRVSQGEGLRRGASELRRVKCLLGDRCDTLGENLKK